ncbi:hypothetical protein [Candidatus Cardinium hertigii]|jgi:hypothetical protein|uniref:Uncharacterized protein n=1 Tax=Candidatus Cardinium hertigii TaxID=247481 RepID=A0A3N2QC06_9BACT|nr:hypothetical protein [Candidatus Cardinium hertigii]ROT47122.1 hypothetical protein EDM02_04535 [Candidatus Cardinium hertigii]
MNNTINKNIKTSLIKPSFYLAAVSLASFNSGCKTWLRDKPVTDVKHTVIKGINDLDDNDSGFGTDTSSEDSVCEPIAPESENIENNKNQEEDEQNDQSTTYEISDIEDDEDDEDDTTYDTAYASLAAKCATQAVDANLKTFRESNDNWKLLQDIKLVQTEVRDFGSNLVTAFSEFAEENDEEANDNKYSTGIMIIDKYKANIKRIIDPVNHADILNALNTVAYNCARNSDNAFYSYFDNRVKSIIASYESLLSGNNFLNRCFLINDKTIKDTVEEIVEKINDIVDQTVKDLNDKYKADFNDYTTNDPNYNQLITAEKAAVGALGQPVPAPRTA